MRTKLLIHRGMDATSPKPRKLSAVVVSGGQSSALFELWEASLDEVLSASRVQGWGPDWSMTGASPFTSET